MQQSLFDYRKETGSCLVQSIFRIRKKEEAAINLRKRCIENMSLCHTLDKRKKDGCRYIGQMLCAA